MIDFSKLPPLHRPSPEEAEAAEKAERNAALAKEFDRPLKTFAGQVNELSPRADRIGDRYWTAYVIQHGQTTHKHVILHDEIGKSLWKALEPLLEKTPSCRLSEITATVEFTGYWKKRFWRDRSGQGRETWEFHANQFTIR